MTVYIKFADGEELTIPNAHFYSGHDLNNWCVTVKDKNVYFRKEYVKYIGDAEVLGKTLNPHVLKEWVNE